MESHNRFIEVEIQEILQILDENEVLSEEDRGELKDHFLSEIEELTELGLRVEEALLIAKKRFGVLEEVQEDYVKVKPEMTLIRYGIIGVVGFCLVKILTILVNSFSQVGWMVIYQFDREFVKEYVFWDVPFRVLLVLFLGFAASSIITRTNFKSLASLWKFPIYYLFIELLHRLLAFILPMSMFMEDMGITMQFFAANTIVSYILLIFIMAISSYKMYIMKIQEMKLV